MDHELRKRGTSRRTGTHFAGTHARVVALSCGCRDGRWAQFFAQCRVARVLDLACELALSLHLTRTMPRGPAASGRISMTSIERRAFMQGAAIGALAFTVGGAEVLLTPREARAVNVPFRLLQAHEGETIEALGETLLP